MKPIPTRPRKRRAQGGLTHGGAYPPSLLLWPQRGGLVLPLPDSVRDRITPPVWKMHALRGRGQREGLLLLPTPRATRKDWDTSGDDIGAAERDGTPHSEEEEEEEEETHPTPTKEAQATPVGIADPPHDHDGGAFAQRVGFGRQRCLTID